jgi:ferredoxin
MGEGPGGAADRDAVMRALMDCPVHAIMEMDERRPDDVPPPLSGDEDPAAHLKTEANEAEWGFTR